MDVADHLQCGGVIVVMMATPTGTTHRAGCLLSFGDQNRVHSSNKRMRSSLAVAICANSSDLGDIESFQARYRLSMYSIVAVPRLCLIRGIKPYAPYQALCPVSEHAHTYVYFVEVHYISVHNVLCVKHDCLNGCTNTCCAVGRTVRFSVA